MGHSLVKPHWSDHLLQKSYEHNRENKEIPHVGRNR